MASAPVWLASASRIGDTVGVLAHKIWISLVEWCDGRTLHGATLEVGHARSCQWRSLVTGAP